MPSRSSFRHVRRLFELIETGPIRVNDLMAEVMPLVPPGMAWRSRESARRYVNQAKGMARHGKPYQFVERPITDRSIMVGQRREVYIQLGKMVNRGDAEYFDHEGERWVRKTTLSGEELRAAKGVGSRKWWDSQDTAQRSALGKASAAALTPEQRSERTRKGWETRRSQRMTLLKPSSE